MKADKNTVIGFILLGILFFAMFWYNNKQYQAQQTTIAKEQKRKDSIEAAKITPAMREKAKADSIRLDSTMKSQAAGGFSNAAIGTEQFFTVENDLIKATFSNKGGKVKFVQLKKYKSYDSSLVQLGNVNDTLGYNINTSPSTSANTNQLFFTAGSVEKDAAGNQSITFSLKDAAGRSLQHKFTIRPNNYMIDWDIQIAGASSLVSNGSTNLTWLSHAYRHEKSATYEKQQTNICFVEDKEFDYISQKTSHKFEKPANWLAVVQQFFNTALIAKNNFASGDVNWARSTVDTSVNLARVDASFQLKLADGTTGLQLYYGPNDYQVLKKQAPEMDRIVNLGRDMYSFVRPINQYIIMPVFNFFAGFISSYGIVILLLTLFIRLITAPLMYGSYLSGAKMKALRPELDAIKAKHGTDQQAFAMDQMKLFREAGVNPLGGCIPALLQIPIFFALYSFFNSNIALRGQSFLWTKDLSSFDAILSWNTDIIAIGNHISLFTITAVITSFLISLYNMSNTPTQDNPALKYMPYIFPFILFFVFNRLPSALTWYYTVSNLITLGLQFVIQTYIIDHKKVLAAIEAKRKAPKKTSKFQEKLAQMQEAQKKMQEARNKGK